MKTKLNYLFTVLALFALSSVNSRFSTVFAQTIENAGFETPSVGPVGDYFSFQYNLIGADWTFDGNAGIAANGSGFAYYNAGTPDGNQFAVLQGHTNEGGTMSQTISNFAAGVYSFTFIASQRDIVGRDNTQNQTVTVYIDTNQIGAFTPADTNWYTEQTTPISLIAGTHTLSLQCIPIAGDATVRLDSFSLEAYITWTNTSGGNWSVAANW